MLTRMTRAYVEAPATHFRLSEETWALIAEEYRNGATAKDLGAKWKVAPSSVYRHACQDGWTKKSMGDARARAHARMVEEEEAAHRALHPVGSRALKALFSPPKAGDPEAGDPEALAREATLASGRAMRGRLWNEAKALAGLAESYARLAEKAAAAAAAAAGSGSGSWETLPLWSLLEVVLDPDGAVAGRFARLPDDEFDPDAEAKAVFWEQQLGAWRAVKADMQELMFRAVYAEKALEELGGTPRVGVTDVEIEAWVRDWLSGPPSEANYLERTRLGQWPWRG